MKTCRYLTIRQRAFVGLLRADSQRSSVELSIAHRQRGRVVKYKPTRLTKYYTETSVKRKSVSAIVLNLKVNSFRY